MPEKQAGHFRRPYKYYKLLGVSRHATQEEIKQAYRQCAKKDHPDVSKNPESQKLFQKINEAYEVLGNENSKLEYDASPTECPDCYTHKVILTVESFYKSRAFTVLRPFAFALFTALSSIPIIILLRTSPSRTPLDVLQPLLFIKSLIFDFTYKGSTLAIIYHPLLIVFNFIP